MEETKNPDEKLTYEQLEQAAMQLQQKLMMAENKFRNIDFASIRLSWLFKVLENEVNFSPEFVDKCANEIEQILTINDTEEEED